MGKVIEKDCLYGNDQYLFIGSRPIPLVQTLGYTYSNPSIDSSFLGEKDSYSLPNGEIKGQLALTTTLLSEDTFYPLSGNVGVNGFLVQNLNNLLDNNFSFVSGYLTSYEQTYSIGTLPNLSLNFEVFREMGNVNSDSYSPGVIEDLVNLSYSSTGILKESAVGGCYVNFPDLDSCPLTSYQISLSCPRLPVYPINKQYPSHVYLTNGVNVKVTFQIEKSDFLMFNPATYPEISQIRNFSIDLLDKNDLSYNSYVFNNMVLDSTSLSSSINSPDTVSLTYRKKA